MNRWHAAIVRTFHQHLSAPLRAVVESRLPQMSAALAYRTIFALVPVVIIGVVVLRLLMTQEDLRRLLNSAASFSGLSAIVADEDAGLATQNPMFRAVGPEAHGAGPADPGLDQQASQPPTPATTNPDNAPALTDALTGFIDGIVGHIGDIPFKAIGGFGLMLLVYAAISMLVEVERAFNQIYRAPRGRSWTRRVPQYWSVLTLGSVLLVATFFVGEQFRQYVEGFTQKFGLFSRQGVLVGIVGYLSTVVISTGLLLFMYMTVPNTRVQFRGAIVGALAAAVLWEAGKWGYTRYLALSTTSRYVYGSVAIVPLFMLWVYLTWLVVLLGLQVSYAIQHGMRTVEVGADDLAPSVVDPARAIDLVAVVASRFAVGQHASMPQIASELSLHPSVVATIIDRCVEAGILLRTEPDGDGQAALTLASPAERIRAVDVLNAVREPGDRAPTPEWDAGSTPSSVPTSRRASASLIAGQLALLAQHTIADILAQAPQPAGAIQPQRTAVG